MLEPQSYRCDLSGRSFPSRSDVRGGLSLDDGNDLYVWADVSPEAARAVLEFINQRFPGNNAVRREAHVTPPEEPEIILAQKLADEEDNALERAREGDPHFAP